MRDGALVTPVRRFLPREVFVAGKVLPREVLSRTSPLVSWYIGASEHGSPEI